MKIVGLMAARNEEWAIGMTLRAALIWCDAVVVGLHACTDATGNIVTDIIHECDKGEHYGKVAWLEYSGGTWEEMAHRQGLLERARELRTVRGEAATHIAYVDADEIISGNLLPSIRGHIERLQVGQMLSLPWLQLRGDVNSVMSSGMWSEQLASTAFRDSPELHWAARNGYDFHQRQPMGRTWQPVEPVGRHRRTAGLMHLQFLSEHRLKAKQYLYQLTERLRWPDRKTPQEIAAMYGRTVRESQTARVQATPIDWWAPYSHLMQHLNIEADPWQLEECRRIIADHPGIGNGLDDFGLGAIIAANAPLPA